MSITLTDEHAAIALRALRFYRSDAPDADEDDATRAIAALEADLRPCPACPGLRGEHKLSCAVGGAGSRAVAVQRGKR